MIEYKYIEKLNFEIPESLLSKVKEIGPAPPNISGLVRMPLYKQINRLLFQKKFESTQLADKYVTGDELREMSGRLDVLDTNWRSKLGEFRILDITGKLADDIIQCLPIQLQKLQPKVCLQTKASGGYITPPHRDHERSCTFWCLLQGNDEQTVWHEKSGNFTEYDFWRIADPRCVTEVKRATLTQHIWYLFDNDSYHSVDAVNTPTLDRTTLCIEFTGIRAKDLYQLYEQSR